MKRACFALWGLIALMPHSAWAQSPAPDVAVEEAQAIEEAPEEEAPVPPDAEAAPPETEEAPEAEEAPQAAAPEDPRLVEARERIARAESFYDRDDYDAALAEFRTTFELLRGHELRFRVLFNIGRCQEKLFRYQDAMVSFRAFLEQGGAYTEQAPDVRAKVELLEGLLGSVHLNVSVHEYEVWVGDRLIGTGLEDILLPSGTHAVEIRRVGYVPNQQQAQVVARSDLELDFEMTRLADEYDGLSPAFFVTATVTTVLALGAGAAFAGLAVSRSNAVEERTPPLATADERAEVRRFALTADVLFGVALLGATSAVIFALFTDWGGEDASALRVAPAVSGTEGGLVLEGAF